MIQYIKWLISPTLFISDYYKKRAVTENERGKRVKKLNKTFAKISIIILITVIILEWFKLIWINTYIPYIIIIYVLSRCNEIFMAFLKDAFDKLNRVTRRKNGLEYFERVQLALRSYIELTLNYGVLYFILNNWSSYHGIVCPFFNEQSISILTAIYISVITSMTVGYGEYYPIHPIAKLLVVYQLITSTLLLLVSFTIYVSLALKD